MLSLIAASLFFPLVLAEDTCYNCHKDLLELELKTPTVLISSGRHLNLSCVDCHSFEALAEGSDEYTRDHERIPRSLSASQNMEACASRCHENTLPLRHGSAVISSPSEASETPVLCTSCHESHETKSQEDNSSWTYRVNVPRTCAGREGMECHDSDAIAREYKILKAYPGYLASGHGRMQSLGYAKAAVCVDCHAPNATSHSSIIAKKSVESPINPGNRERTCTQDGCHVGKDVKVGRGSMHGRSELVIGGVSIERVIDGFYKLMITVFVGGASLFILLDFARRRIR